MHSSIAFPAGKHAEATASLSMQAPRARISRRARVTLAIIAATLACAAIPARAAESMAIGEHDGTTAPTGKPLAARAPGTPSGPDIYLWDEGVRAPGQVDDFRPYLQPYLLPAVEGKPRGAVIVLPGGGYAHRSPREAGNVADRFNQAGLNALVLQYRVAPNRHPAPLLDIQRAVRLTRAHAASLGIRPDKIAVCGFSAGGHLAACAGVFYGWNIKGSPDDLQGVSARPDALILCYPVISSGQYAHKGSFMRLLGDPPPAGLLRVMSVETQVTPWTPPTFLWATADDPTVPVQNSVMFAQALRRHGVPCELKIFPHGRHGMNLGIGDPLVSKWPGMAIDWLAEMDWPMISPGGKAAH
jgi:acetyl esterase/lipase